MPKNRSCWCPCKCGCTEPDWEVSLSGLCPDCENGNHEVPPEGVNPGVEDLLKLHESIIAQFKLVLRERKSALPVVP